ncbi:MAG: 50S ribosomal protein L24 [Clostridia bacterium]
MKMAIKKDDTVLVLAGKDKGKQGKVQSTMPKSNKVLIDGVNVVSKHQKPKSQTDKGGIIKRNAPIDASNAMIICPICGKATRVAHKEVAGKNSRVCKKCGESLDKKFVKATKKVTKKDQKVANVTDQKAVKEPKVQKQIKETGVKISKAKSVTKIVKKEQKGK